MIKYNLNKIEKKVNKHSNKKWNKLKYRLKTFFDIWIQVAWDIRIGFVESILLRKKKNTKRVTILESLVILESYP